MYILEFWPKANGMMEFAMQLLFMTIDYALLTEFMKFPIKY